MRHSLSQEHLSIAMSTSASSRQADYFGSRPLPRTRPSASGIATAGSPLSSPRTPLIGRSISGQFGSPGGLSREPDETVIYELHPRHISAGFSGESKPRCVHRFGYQLGDGRRVGDFRDVVGTARTMPSPGRNDESWSAPYELFRADVSHLDLDLMSDRLERALRQVHSDHLQLPPNRPLKAVLALPTLLPTPVLEVVLRVLFQHYAQPPTITLFTTPILACVGAGLRNALAIEIGWDETVVTAVGEYKAVAERRSIRGGRMLVREMAGLLEESGAQKNAPFTFAEDFTRRMAWCRPRLEEAEDANEETTINIPTPGDASKGLHVQFSKFARPAETTFFNPSTDDHDLSLPALMFHTLLTLPVDLRSVCMSRITITGSNNAIPGLKARLLSEFSHLADKRGWDVVDNYGSAKKPLPHRLRESQLNATPLQSADANGSIPISERPHDDLADRLSQQVLHSSAKGREKVVKGVVRGVETLGAWSAASLVAGLRIKGKGEVERDEFLKDSGVIVDGVARML